MKMVIVFITNRINNIISFINKLFYHHKNDTDLIYEYISEMIENELSKLTSLDKNQKIIINEDIKKKISYYNHPTDEIETRRIRLVESSWLTIIILIAASGLLISVKLTWIILYPVLITFCIQIIFAIAKLQEYHAQSGFKYPLNDSRFGNRWKWFYKANPFIESIDPHPFQKEDENQKIIFHI